MKRFDARAVVGLLLLVVGTLLLLENLGLLGVAWNTLWALLFGVAGIAFLALFLSGRDHWWAAIPGFTLLALGAVVGLQDAGPQLSARWGGTLFLGGIGLGFLATYLARTERWWALIPSGVLLTLATVAAVSQDGDGQEGGTVFFLGLALTFGLVYLLPLPRRRMTWALIPAAVFLVLAAVTAAATRSILNYLWPAILILLGLYLVYRSMRGSRG